MTAAQIWLRAVTVAFTATGTMFAFGTGCINKIAKNVNPCGTILNCDPLEYDLLFTDFANYPDWDVDPTCTIPGLCGSFPIGPNAATTSTAATTTTTTGTTSGLTNTFGGFY